MNAVSCASCGAIYRDIGEPSELEGWSRVAGRWACRPRCRRALERTIGVTERAGSRWAWDARRRALP